MPVLGRFPSGPERIREELLDWRGSGMSVMK